MKVYSIEELHNLIVNQEIDLNEYYYDLFKEVEFQQNRLNAFVTITKTQAMDNIKELKISDEEILRNRDSESNNIPLDRKQNKRMRKQSKW